jgi:hypothetical protein
MVRRLFGSISFFTRTFFSTSVPDPFRFDPHPGINTQYRYHWIRIRLLLVSSMAFRMSTKIIFFLFFCSFLTVGAFTQDNKSLGSHKTVEIHDFLIYCLLMEGSRAGYVEIIPDPGGSKRPDPDHCLRSLVY